MGISEPSSEGVILTIRLNLIIKALMFTSTPSYAFTVLWLTKLLPLVLQV
jgi:hypothetical protein